MIHEPRWYVSSPGVLDNVCRVGEHNELAAEPEKGKAAFGNLGGDICKRTGNCTRRRDVGCALQRAWVAWIQRSLAVNE